MTSRAAIANQFLADIVRALLICAALPLGCVALLVLRIGEAVFDSRAGQAAYRFWFGRRG